MLVCALNQDQLFLFVCFFSKFFLLRYKYLWCGDPAACGQVLMALMHIMHNFSNRVLDLGHSCLQDGNLNLVASVLVSVNVLNTTYDLGYYQMDHGMLSLLQIWPIAFDPLFCIWSQSSLWILLSAAILAQEKWAYFSRHFECANKPRIHTSSAMILSAPGFSSSIVTHRVTHKFL